MKLLKCSLAVPFFLPFLVVSAAGSTITGTTGSMTENATPASVVEEGLESDTEIFVFAEQLDITLVADVDVNVTAPGTYTSSPGTTQVAAGTRLDSYLIHMDIVDVADGGIGEPLDLSGSVTFDAPILGIIGTDGSLDASDAALGAPGTSYPTGVASRGFWESADSVTLSADRRTLTLNNMRVWDVTDQLRVLVVPEPGPAALLSLGLILLTAHRRRA